MPKPGCEEPQSSDPRPRAADSDRENVANYENLMRMASGAAQEQSRSRVQPMPADNSSQSRVQEMAEQAMRIRRMKHFAEGGVLAPTAPQPQTSAWQQLWSRLMGKEALSRAAGTAPTPSTPPQNQDISVVRQAAKEAGERMEAEKAQKEAAKSKYGGYGK